MTTIVNVENELSRISDVYKKDEESTQQFLRRLAKAYSGFKDSVIDALSEEAYIWGENAVTAINSNRPIPGFEAQVVKGESMGEVPVLETHEAPAPKRGTPLKPGQMSDAVRAKVGRPKKEATQNYTRTFREHFIRNMSESRQVMLDKLFDEHQISVGTHISEATVNATIYHTRQTIQLIHDVFGVDVTNMDSVADHEGE